MTVHLIIGGARSGKSHYAETLSSMPRHYIATAQAFDDEMRDRIAHHKVQRGNGWVTLEAPLDLVSALETSDGLGRFILVDCLTLWLSNLILNDRDWNAAVNQLITIIPALKADVVFVSNEVGLGIVPDNALARQFRDAQGITNQRVAGAANKVVLMAAGLPLVLKSES